MFDCSSINPLWLTCLKCFRLNFIICIKNKQTCHLETFHAAVRERRSLSAKYSVSPELIEVVNACVIRRGQL